VLLWGLVLALRRPGFLQSNALLLGFAVFYTLLHLLTWAMVRYRLPVDAVLLPIAAWGLSDLLCSIWTILPLRTTREPA
jgi:hypothetical protein